MNITLIDKMLNANNNGERVCLFNYFNSESDFLNATKDYLTQNPSKAGELKVLIATVTTNKQNHVFYLNETLIGNQPQYAYLIQKVLKAYKISINEAVRKALNSNEIHNNFDNIISLFEKRYVNSSIYMPTLIKINEAMKEVGTKEQRNVFLNINAFRNVVSNNDEKLIEDIYNSNLSIYDYAFDNVIDIHNLVNILRAGKVKEITKRNKEILNRPFKREQEVIDILYRVIEEDLDIIEYYKICKIAPFYLKLIAVKHDIRHKKLSIFFGMTLNNDSNIEIAEDKALEEERIFGKNKITQEGKEYAINYLKENNIPLTRYTYNTMLRKIANEGRKNLVLKLG